MLPNAFRAAASISVIPLFAASCSPSYTAEFEQWPAISDASVASIAPESRGPGDAAPGPAREGGFVDAQASPVPQSTPPTGADAASPFGTSPAPSAGSPGPFGTSPSPVDSGAASADAADASTHPRPDAGTPRSHAATIVVTTVDDGQGYSPENVGAIWIAQSSGAFVKTLEEWGKARIDHLILWNQATSGAGLARNTVDAITGATQYAFGTYVVYWNFTDTTEKAVPNGTYRAYFETADWNVTGPNTFVEFTTGTAATFTYPDTTHFINLEVVVSP